LFIHYGRFVLAFIDKDLVVDKYKVVAHLHNPVVAHLHNPVVVDKHSLDYMADNLVVDLEVDNKLGHLQDNIAVVEEVDHNLVDRKHLLLVSAHLVVDNT
jgi:hypothetical protein